MTASTRAIRPGDMMRKYLIGAALAALLPMAAMAQSIPTAGVYKSTGGQIQQADAVQLLGPGSSAPVSVATAVTTQLVALAAGKAIYVKAAELMAAGATTVTLEYGTGTLCATGLTTLTGAFPLAAQSRVSIGNGSAAVLTVPSGNALCVVNSAAVQVSGFVAYDQQ